MDLSNFEKIITASIIKNIKSGVSNFCELIEKSNGADPLILKSLIHNLRREGGIDLPYDFFDYNKENCLENWNSPYVELSPPHPADYDWRFTQDCLRKLTNTVNENGKKNIALLGVISLFPSLNKYGHNVVTFNKNESLLNDLRAGGYEDGLFKSDLLIPLPKPYHNKFDVVVADPPWYIDYYTAFALRANELLNNRGILIITIPKLYTKFSSINDREKINNLLSEAGFEKFEELPNIIRYETPSFELKYLARSGINCKNWRRSDLFILKKVKTVETNFSIVPDPPEQRWEEFLIKGKKIKLKKTIPSPKKEFSWSYAVSSNKLPNLISRYSEQRQKIDLWTSDNYAFSIVGYDTINTVLEALSEGHSFRNALNHIDEEKRKNVKSLLDEIF